jgi:hypothetical protein
MAQRKSLSYSLGESKQSSEERIPGCFLALIIYGVARKPYRAADGRDVSLLKAPLPAEERRWRGNIHGTW